MVRSVLAEDYLLPYFKHVALRDSCTVGLILGQSTSGRDFIIHFAKTPRYEEDDSKYKSARDIGDVKEGWVAEHARQTTRMLPGGMHVLGIFVVCREDVLVPFSPKLKSILSQVHTALQSNKYLYGNTPDREKLVLNYCTKNDLFTCKSYDVLSAGVRPVDFKFSPRCTNWVQLECKYDLDEVYAIEKTEKNLRLKKHMGMILDKVNANLEKSIFFFDGEFKNKSDLIENIIKKKKVVRSIKSTIRENESNSNTPIQVSIYETEFCSDKNRKKMKVYNSSSQIKIKGQVACVLWLSPKATVETASEYIVQDIMRSLSTRMEMHWDSLTEEEHKEDVNSIHEPPRRVLVALPNSKIMISDYLFPGEGPNDAQSSLEETLDIKISDKLDFMDVEGQADLSEYCLDALESDSEPAVPKQARRDGQLVMFIGLGVAFLVLIISLVIHFIQRGGIADQVIKDNNST